MRGVLFLDSITFRGDIYHYHRIALRSLLAPSMLVVWTVTPTLPTLLSLSTYAPNTAGLIDFFRASPVACAVVSFTASSGAGYTASTRPVAVDFGRFLPRSLNTLAPFGSVPFLGAFAASINADLAILLGMAVSLAF